MQLKKTIYVLSFFLCFLGTGAVFAETTEVRSENFNQWKGGFSNSSGLSADFSYHGAYRSGNDTKTEVVKEKFGDSSDDISCYLGVSHASPAASGSSIYFVMEPKSDLQIGENGASVLEFDFAVDAFSNSKKPQLSVGGHLWTTPQDLSGEVDYQKTVYDNYGKYEVSGKMYSYLEVRHDRITVFGTDHPLLVGLSAQRWHNLSLKVYPDNTYTLMVDDVLIALREKIKIFNMRYRYKNTAKQNVDVYRTTSQFRGFKEIWFQYYGDNEVTGKQGYYLDNVSLTTTDSDVQDSYPYPYAITGIETYGDNVLEHGLSGGRTIQRIYLKKLTDEQKSLCVLTVLYRGEKILDVGISSFAEPKLIQGEDESLALEAKLELPEDISDCKVKVMLWEDGALMPLANIFSLDENGKSLLTTYTQKGFSQEDVAAFAENAVILHAGNHQCYVDNIKMNFQEDDNSVAAYRKGSSIYAPAMSMLHALGFEDISENILGMVAYKNGQRYLLRADGGSIACEYQGDRLYVDIKMLADAAGIGYYQAENVAIVSQKESVIAEVSEEVLEVIRQSLAYRWKNVYLGSRGYVPGLIAHPKKTDIIYARTDVGGIYRYNSKSGTWKQLMATIPLEDENLLSVRSIALDPKDENVIYAACGATDTDRPADILKSVDKGENWVRLQFNHGFGGNQGESRLAGECLAVDPNDSDIIYCGTYSEGLFVSCDAGVHWKKVASIPEGGTVEGGVSAVYIDESAVDRYGRSKNIYVAVWGEGIYVSHDGGDTFMQLQGAPKMTCRMEMVDEKLYVSATDIADSNEYVGGFFCLENEEWKNLTPDATVGYTYTNAANAFLIDKNNHDVIYLNGANYRETVLVRSNDGGESWEHISDGFSAACLLQDPLNEKGIWIAYGAGITYITDMYDTASNINTDAINNKYCYDKGVEELVSVRLLSIPSEQAPVLLAQNMDFGMMKSSNLDELAQESYPQISHGSGVDYCEEDPSIVFRTGIVGRVKLDTSFGTAAISKDYGNTFTFVSGWNKSRIPIIDCAIGAQKQENGHPILFVLAATTLGTMEATEEDIEKSGLYRSKDLGVTWEKVSVITDYITNKWGFDDFRLAADRVDGNTFYYTNNGKIYVTTDGGNTWKHSYTFPANSNPFIKAVPGIAGAVWYKDKDGIYMSYDRGESWSHLKGMESPAAFGFGVGKSGEVDKPATYAVGTVNGVYGIYLSDDFGNSWKRLNSDANTTIKPVNDIIGDSRIYGRVFLSSSGAGVFYGEPVDESYMNP